MASIRLSVGLLTDYMILHRTNVLPMSYRRDFDEKTRAYQPLISELPVSFHHSFMNKCPDLVSIYIGSIPGGVAYPFRSELHKDSLKRPK